jgi:hypothetical protein
VKRDTRTRSITDFPSKYARLPSIDQRESPCIWTAAVMAQSDAVFFATFGSGPMLAANSIVPVVDALASVAVCELRDYLVEERNYAGLCEVRTSYDLPNGAELLMSRESTILLLHMTGNRAFAPKYALFYRIAQLADQSGD